MKKNNMLLYLIGTFCIACTGIFLPGVLLHQIGENKLNTVVSASNETFNSSNSVIARNSSQKLSNYEKMKLVSGIWESDITEGDYSEATLDRDEAVALATEKVNTLAENDLYPTDISSTNGNWYSWDTVLYKATETTFHTYSTYFWLITFTRYDNKQTHQVLMLEDGTVLFAYAKMSPCSKKNLYSFYRDKMSHNYTILVSNKFSNTKNGGETPPDYAYVDTSHLETQQVYELTTKRTDLPTEHYITYTKWSINEYYYCFIANE